MVEIQGSVEAIVFQNEDNGYVVATIKYDDSKVTIVGVIPYVVEGQTLKLKGQWSNHKKFGQQFKVEECEEVLPDSVIGIERYLSSGVVQGIGPVTARKIVEHFGTDTLKVMEEDIERLKEIEGIGEKKIKVIAESFATQRDIRSIMVFLQTYGVTPTQCNKIYKRFGKAAIEMVKNNPYILTEEISGIGFKTADKIARSLGIEITSPYRIQSGIIYLVKHFSLLGNTYMPLEKLISEGKDILGVDAIEIEKNLQECILDLKLKVEEFDQEICVFDLPYYYSELSVTSKLLTLATSPYEDLKIDTDTEISDFEEKNNILFAESQKEAVRGAIENGIEVITGGPGTGKTTIINCINSIFKKHSFKVSMAAPTGRAAKRMTESTGQEAKTIHRLLELGFSEDEGNSEFIRNEESPLNCDVLIVDEASMIDIMLMSNLLKAVALGTRLIIVGDVDQLPSVGPGNVLRDIIDSNAVKVVKLNEIFRQSKESMIIVNAHMINSGKIPLLNSKDKDFFFITKESPNDILEEIKGLIHKRLPSFNKKWDNIRHIQILTPMRRGALGVETINGQLQEILNPYSSIKKEIEFRNTIFRIGDKVMQTKNNYQIKWERISGNGEKDGMGIFNGDIGYIDDIDEANNRLHIIFDDERMVKYEDCYFDELELAYAMTIHKSQGSEFPVVIMPMFMGAPMLMNKNLLYTGVTRAKELVVLVGNKKALNFMVENTNSVERYSGLCHRITDILG